MNWIPDTRYTIFWLGVMIVSMVGAMTATGKESEFAFLLAARAQTESASDGPTTDTKPESIADKVRRRFDELSEGEPTEEIQTESERSVRPDVSGSEDGEPDDTAEDESEMPDDDSEEDGEHEDGEHEDNDQKDTQLLRQRSTMAHLVRLRKPVDQIQLGFPDQDKKTPANQAMLGIPQDTAIEISAMGLPIPGPNRYTIGFCHRPLYYEQKNLERCGRTVCDCGYLQNAVSGFQLIATTMVLPYKLVQQHPDCPVPAGGDCQTCQSYPLDLNPFPLDRHALVAELAAIGGFTFLLL